MEKRVSNEIKAIEEPCEKKSYEKPKIEEHEPLEKSTAVIYYYYTYGF